MATTASAVTTDGAMTAAATIEYIKTEANVPIDITLETYLLTFIFPIFLLPICWAIVVK